MKTGKISISHGGGGRAMHDLIKDVFISRFKNRLIEDLNDSAVIGLEPRAERIAFTTDSYVISPPVFRGGDIGKLAVCGTINDLVVSGAEPRWLTAGFIAEEGCRIALLEQVAGSMADVCALDGVKIAAGDFKVVEKGGADGVFINTSGIGIMPRGLDLGPEKIKPSDKIIISGTLGDHEAAILVERGGFGSAPGLKSDCCSLYSLIKEVCGFHLGVLSSGGDEAVKFMRDPTRGGLASVLNEIAPAAGAGFELEEKALPVRDEVLSVCEILGLDPLYLANEGKAVIFVNEKYAEECLGIIKRHPLGTDARVIGAAAEGPPGRVVLNTAAGGRRIIRMIEGGQVPRIC